jgi:glycyl-tRNA synthetase beta chain
MYRGVRPGKTLTDGLQAALLTALERLPIPKVMSYQLDDGITTVQFVRPAQRLLALHGDQVITVHALGLTAGRETLGHRFHAPAAVALDHANHYETVLEQKHVLASFDQRRERIVGLLQAEGKRLNATVIMPDDLVDEVAALVEWPVVYESGFDVEFLEVPQSCLILTMQLNQKYFALADAQGKLINRFLLVSNIQASDPSAIITGNARVIRARLADAKFFFDQDRLHRLESRLPGAEAVVYHRNLGSQAQRNARLVTLAMSIGRALTLSADQLRDVERAATLAKADLATLMVGEFPELQGEMGALYARHQGENEAVCLAIDEHYRPRFAGDAVAQSVVGACVALADKLETLAGLFGAGERPTGDRDPFALRRNALGVLRTLELRALPLSLRQLIDLAFQAFDPASLPAPFTCCADDLAAFLYERLRGMLIDQGFHTREVDAVISLAPQRIDRVGQRMNAIRAFMQLPEAANLAAANKRIGNILRKNAESVQTVQGDFDASVLTEAAEQDLIVAYRTVRGPVDAALAAGNDAAVLAALAPLKLPVDRFFDDVMVMADDPVVRHHRLALLAALQGLMNQVADISQLAAG